jgi:hypothetical protein
MTLNYQTSIREVERENEAERMEIAVKQFGNKRK